MAAQQPPSDAFDSYKSTKLITSKQVSVWEMVIQRHHEVCSSLFHAKCCAKFIGHVDADHWLKLDNGSLAWKVVFVVLFHLGVQLLCPVPCCHYPGKMGTTRGGGGA
jgi:hypothetical protein